MLTAREASAEAIGTSDELLRIENSVVSAWTARFDAVGLETLDLPAL